MQEAGLGMNMLSAEVSAAAADHHHRQVKAEIATHPLCEQLLAAHVSCLRVATPIDQLPLIDAQLSHFNNLLRSYASHYSHSHDRQELDNFMTQYLIVLCALKEQLQQHVRVHAVEAVMACRDIESTLQALTGVSLGEGSGATMSDDEEDFQMDGSLDQSSADGHDMMGFGPLLPTESERSLMERVRQELKIELKQGFKSRIEDVREEILRKRRAGKLPGDTTSVLKAWWQQHAKWPYPTEDDKAKLVEETGLQLKQINNWFINQRKRNWHSNSQSVTSLKSKRRDVLIDGVRTLPQNKLLLEELINFSMMHGGTKHMAVIDSIIADTISPRSGSQGLSAEDAEDISNLYLEFVDYIGTIHDVRKAWNRHIKLFPDSARKDLHEQSARHRKLLNLMNRREEISVVIPNQASRVSISNLQAHLHKNDKKVALLKCCDNQCDSTNDGLLLRKNKNTCSNDTDAYKLQIMELDDKIEENGREFSLPVSEEPRDNDPENNVSSSTLVEVKEESTRVVKNIKNSSESDVSSEEFLRQTGYNQSSQALQTPSKESTSFSKEKCEFESEELKPRSLKSISLKPQECVAIPESHKSNSRPIIGGHTINEDNSASTQDFECTQVCKSPYSARHRDQRARKPFLPPRSSGNSGGNWHRKRNAGQFKGPKFGYRGNTDRKQHQRQQLSPQQIHPPEAGAQMAGTSDYSSQQCNPGQNQFQSTAAATGLMAAPFWPMQNMQMQNTSSQSQTPVNTTSLVLQHPMQGNGQYGYMQNAQEYSQSCQYYYYQQQQQQQLQQHYIQLQQQPFQQEQSQQLQHSSLEPLQPQQLQQQVLPQQQYYQQQQPLQQEHPSYIVHQQQPLQQEHPSHIMNQHQPLQQEHPSHIMYQQQPSTQSSSHPAEDQGQAILTLQGNGAIVSQQSDKLGSISSPVVHYSEEKSTQE